MRFEDVRPKRHGHGGRHAVVFAMALAAMLAACGATGTTGAKAAGGQNPQAIPGEVTVEPTGGLDDGQVVLVRVKADENAKLFSLRARLCRAGAPVHDDYSFSPDAGLCPLDPLSPSADAVAAVSADGAPEASLPFRVGVGASAWNDLDGKPARLACGARDKCQLVVEVGLDGENRYWSTDVTYAPGARQKPAPPPPTAGDLSPADSGLAGAASAGGAPYPLAASRPGYSPEATLAPPVAGLPSAPTAAAPNSDSAAKPAAAGGVPWLPIVAFGLVALGMVAWLLTRRDRAPGLIAASDGTDPTEPVDNKEFSHR
jgi:hypothetical protein